MEFQFLGEWQFSYSLQESLKHCTLSPFYTFKLRSGWAEDMNPSSADKLEKDQKILKHECDEYNDNMEIDDLASETNYQDSYCEVPSNEAFHTSFNIMNGSTISGEELCNLNPNELTPILEKASDTDVLNFCESLCSSQKCQPKLVQVLCEDILLPKIQDSSVDSFSLPLSSAIKRAYETFPYEACNYILLPVFQESKLLGKLNPVFINLDDSSKQVIFKSLLENGVHVIEESHMPLLQILLTSSMDTNSNELLINLMLTSCSNLSKSSKFGKFLVCVIKQIGSSLQSQARYKLFSVIESHKSFQRMLALKAYESLDVS